MMTWGIPLCYPGAAMKSICPHSKRCPGCTKLAVPYERQILDKERVVAQRLGPLAGLGVEPLLNGREAVKEHGQRLLTGTRVIPVQIQSGFQARSGDQRCPRFIRYRAQPPPVLRSLGLLRALRILGALPLSGPAGLTGLG